MSLARADARPAGPRAPFPARAGGLVGRFLVGAAGEAVGSAVHLGLNLALLRLLAPDARSPEVIFAAR